MNINKEKTFRQPSKSLGKTEINNLNKNKFQNKTKLKQNKNFQNINNNILRGKSKVDQNKKTKVKNTFPSKSPERKNSNIIINQKDININDNIIQINNKISNNFKSDIKNEHFFKTKEKTIKINFKKILKKANMSDLILEDTTYFENLKYIPLDDISSLFKAWQNTSVIYKAFEDKLLKKNNFEIDKKTLKIITKNEESEKSLYNQRFWILYIEYLIEKNLLLNEKQFLSVINEAFSYMNPNEKYPFQQLKIYYLEKIKKYAPCYLPNGDFDDNDNTYLNKLDKSIVAFINNKNFRENKYAISIDDKIFDKNDDKSNKNIIFEESDITKESN